jgi:hypothetical protein
MSAELRPGVVPLRPLGLGEVLDGTITTIRRHWRVALGLSALLVSAQELIQLVLQALTGVASASFNPLGRGGGTVDSTAALSLEGRSLAVSAVSGLVGAIIGAVLTGMLAVVVAEAVLGRSVTFGEVWSRVRPQLLRLVGGSLLAGILPWLGVLVAAAVGLLVALANPTAGVVLGAVLAVLLLIVPGVPLWVLLSLTAPALVLERLGPIAALKRSWRLVQPDFWRIFGIRLLSVLIATIVSGIISAPIALLGLLAVFGAGGGATTGGAPLLFLVIVAIGGVIGGTITQPFLAGVLALLYVDRRMRGEGLDIVLQQAAREGRSAPVGPAPAPGWS